MTAAEAAMVDGLLVHPDPTLLARAEATCPPEALTSGPHRAAYRALLAAWRAGEIPAEPGHGVGYVVAAGRIRDHGGRPADVFGLGRLTDRYVDTREPLAAAEVVAEAHRRRILAADLAAAAEAVAAGADPDAVLTRLGVGG